MTLVFILLLVSFCEPLIFISKTPPFELLSPTRLNFKPEYVADNSRLKLYRLKSFIDKSAVFDTFYLHDEAVYWNDRELSIVGNVSRCEVIDSDNILLLYKGTMYLKTATSFIFLQHNVHLIAWDNILKQVWYVLSDGHVYRRLNVTDSKSDILIASWNISNLRDIEVTASYPLFFTMEYEIYDVNEKISSAYGHSKIPFVALNEQVLKATASTSNYNEAIVLYISVVVFVLIALIRILLIQNGIPVPERELSSLIDWKKRGREKLHDSEVYPTT